MADYLLCFLDDVINFCFGHSLIRCMFFIILFCNFIRFVCSFFKACTYSNSKPYKIDLIKHSESYQIDLRKHCK